MRPTCGVVKGTQLIVLVATLATSGCTSVHLANPAKPVPDTGLRSLVAGAAKAGNSLKNPFGLIRPEFRSAKRPPTASAAATPALTPASAPTSTPPSPTPPAPTDGLEDIVAVGFASIGAQSGKDPAQQRLMAARASKIDAYRNLAEQVYGVTIGSETILEDHKLQADAVRTRINGMLSGAELVSMEPLGSDSYQTTLRLPARQVAQLRQRLQR